LVLVDDPIERAAVAEAIVEDDGRDAGECQGFVVLRWVLSLVSRIL
jgi:hypothetical protein